MDKNKQQEDYVKAYQQWQLIVIQKEQLVMQLSEIENTISELKKINESKVYKIAGNVMVKKDKDEILKDLNDKKQLLELKIRSLEKQEVSLREKLKSVNDKSTSG